MNARAVHLIEPVILSARPEQDEYWFREGCHVTELSNCEADEAVSVARVRLPAGGQTRWHALVDTVERYVILAGRGEVELGDSMAKAVHVHDVVIIPPDCPQRIANIGKEDLEFLAICSPRFEERNYRDLE